MMTKGMDRVVTIMDADFELATWGALQRTIVDGLCLSVPNLTLTCILTAVRSSERKHAS